MLVTLLIMTCVGTAVIAAIIAALEWHALVGYWRASRAARTSPIRDETPDATGS